MMRYSVIPLKNLFMGIEYFRKFVNLSSFFEFFLHFLQVHMV